MQTAERPAWLRMLTRTLEERQIELVYRRQGKHYSARLDCGPSGQVFLVRWHADAAETVTEVGTGQLFALKIVDTENDITHLKAEVNKRREHRKHLDELTVNSPSFLLRQVAAKVRINLAHFASAVDESTDGTAAVLFQPVGFPLSGDIRPSEEAYSRLWCSAMCALVELHLVGILHGNARTCNLLSSVELTSESLQQPIELRWVNFRSPPTPPVSEDASNEHIRAWPWQRLFLDDVCAFVTASFDLSRPDFDEFAEVWTQPHLVEEYMQQAWSQGLHATTGTASFETLDDLHTKWTHDWAKRIYNEVAARALNRC